MQHDGHHALLLKKKQHQLQMNPILTLGNYRSVAFNLELMYSRFREEPIQVVSVRITQRFAGHGGVRLI